MLSLDLTASSITVPVPLCKSHYHMIYKVLNPIQRHCITCNVSLRHKLATKLCPQPSTIEKHLREKMGFDGKIGVTDLVCYSCYRSHLYILKHKTNFSDNDELKELISVFDKKIKNHDGIKPVESPDEQLVLYPLSLCDNEGNPNKGQKHYFTKVIRNDPDLGRLNNSDLPKIVQSLYACTGCDYISFLAQ